MPFTSDAVAIICRAVAHVVAIVIVIATLCVSLLWEERLTLPTSAFYRYDMIIITIMTTMTKPAAPLHCVQPHDPSHDSHDSRVSAFKPSSGTKQLAAGMQNMPPFKLELEVYISSAPSVSR